MFSVMVVCMMSPLSLQLTRLIEQISTIIVGKRPQIEDCVACLLAGGHLLIEDLPGVGKTTLAHALAVSLGLRFSRMQFTADLMPSDLLGVSIYERSKEDFVFHPGPIFAQVLLADEINRASPKTQSALLEAMEEKQVTVEGETRPLPTPFFVIATQNPHDQLGTFALPESQLDRFLMRIRIGYPDAAAEREIVRQSGGGGKDPARAVISGEELTALQDAVEQIAIDESLVDYMLAIVERTRAHESLAMGVSPRGAQALYRAAQALAAVEGRDYVTPDDVKRLVVPVFAHRVVVNTRISIAQRSAEVAEKILGEILTLVDVPL